MPNFAEYEGSKGKCVCVSGVVVLRETDAALLIQFEDGNEAWVPKSQIDDDSEVYEEDHEGMLIITAWLAKQKGWI